MKLNIVVISICISSLFGCSYNVSNDNQDDQVVYDFMYDKLKANGPNMFCSQSSYVSCFSISTTQCFSELATESDRCLQLADNRYSKVKQRSVGKLVKYYAMCMVTRHVSKHSDKQDHIMSCIKDSKLDPDLAIKGIFR